MKKILILLSFLSTSCFAQRTAIQKSFRTDTTACVLLVTSKGGPVAKRIEGFKVLISIPDKPVYSIVNGKVVWVSSTGKYNYSIIYLDSLKKELSRFEIWGIFQK